MLLNTEYNLGPLGYPNYLNVSSIMYFLSLMGGTYFGEVLSPNNDRLLLESMETYLLCLATLALAAIVLGISWSKIYLRRAWSKVMSLVHLFRWKDEHVRQCQGPRGSNCSLDSTQLLCIILEQPQHSLKLILAAILQIQQFCFFCSPSYVIAWNVYISPTAANISPSVTI